MAGPSLGLYDSGSLRHQGITWTSCARPFKLTRLGKSSMRCCTEGGEVLRLMIEILHGPIYIYIYTILVTTLPTVSVYKVDV